MGVHSVSSPYFYMDLSGPHCVCSVKAHNVVLCLNRLTQHPEIDCNTQLFLTPFFFLGGGGGCLRELLFFFARLRSPNEPMSTTYSKFPLFFCKLNHNPRFVKPPVSVLQN